MSYLELLSWARKGILGEIDTYRDIKEKALCGEAHDLARFAQETIDALNAKYATLEEIEAIHNRK